MNGDSMKHSLAGRCFDSHNNELQSLASRNTREYVWSPRTFFNTSPATRALITFSSTWRVSRVAPALLMRRTISATLAVRTSTPFISSKMELAMSPALAAGLPGVT